MQNMYNVIHSESAARVGLRRDPRALKHASMRDPDTLVWEEDSVLFRTWCEDRANDPRAEHIRRALQERARVPDGRVHAPWQTTPLEHQVARCEVGRACPAPLVRRDPARQRTLARHGKPRAT